MSSSTTASLIDETEITKMTSVDYEELEELVPMVNEIISRENYLMAMADEHIHAQRVPPCTYGQGGDHNINCQRGIDASLLEYHHLVSKGLIREKDYEEWGCIDAAEEQYHQDIADRKVDKAFMAVDWDAGFTGRGMRKSTLDHTDAVGPMDEFEPSGMSPLELNSVELSRTETCGTSQKGVFQDVEGADPIRRSQILNNRLGEGLDDEVDTFRERIAEDIQSIERRGSFDFGRSNEEINEVDIGATNAATPDAETTHNDRRDILANIASLGCQMLGDEEAGPPCETSSPAPFDHNTEMGDALADILSEANTEGNSNAEDDSAETLENRAEHLSGGNVVTTHTGGKKRVSQPLPTLEASRAKRLCTSRVDRTNTIGQVRDILTDIAGRGPPMYRDPAKTTAAPSPHARTSYTSKKRGRETLERTNPKEDGRLLNLARKTKRVRRYEPSEVASTAPPAKSDRKLRSRAQHAVLRFQCGNIVYDTKARSFPKISNKGTLVDSRGNVVLGTEGEVKMALKNTQLRRKAGLKLVLRARPNLEEEEEEVAASTPSELRVRDAGVAKRSGKGKGARRFGVDRRAGHWIRLSSRMRSSQGSRRNGDKRYEMTFEENHVDARGGTRLTLGDE